MDMQRLLTSLSSKIIVQFGIVVVALGIVIAWQSDFIYQFYFANQLTKTGLIINSMIILLWVSGMLDILYHLYRYKQEEKTIAGFATNIERFQADLAKGLAPESILAKRYTTMQSIQAEGGEINHSALSAMLSADEGTKIGLVRFINNILILTGVFGTIVALSIALVGASDLIDSASGSLGGMGLVIHGMSTALSTTITAIVSYIIFGYFYTRLIDVQTHFISGIEHITSVYLLPQFIKRSDEIAYKIGDLIKSLLHAADKLQDTQEVYYATAINMKEVIAGNQDQIDQFSKELTDIKSLLREGFRLPVARSENE